MLMLLGKDMDQWQDVFCGNRQEFVVGLAEYMAAEASSTARYH